MFTGIIEAIGEITHLSATGKDRRLTITARHFDLSDLKLGDSIAVNGVCLTVVELTPASFSVDVSHETLRCTQGLTQVDSLVNLEKALRVGDRLGGHFVSGHVDGVAEVILFEPEGESMHLVIEITTALCRYIAQKGSVTINGVSLTVNHIEDNRIHINLIPHTLAQTNLHTLQMGDNVNVEVDLIARHLESLLTPS